MFVILLPPLSGFDESAHFLRAYEISEGHVIPTAVGRDVAYGTFPRQLHADLERTVVDLISPGRNRVEFLSHLGDAPASGPRTRTRIGAIAGYSPLPYLPAALAIRFGRVANASTVLLVYLARLANLAAYVAIATLAILRAPRAKTLLSVAALLPTALVAATNVSADGVTYALVLLVVAMVLDRWESRDVWQRHDVALLLVVTCALGLSKPPYALAAVLIFACLRYVRRIQRVLLAIAALFPSVIMVEWGQLMRRPLATQDIVGFIDQRDRFHPYLNVDSGRQLRDHVIGAPLEYLGVLVGTFQRFGLGWLRDAPGQLKIATSTTGGVAVFAWVALVGAAVVSGASPGASGGDANTSETETTTSHRNLLRFMLVAVATVVALATFTGAYLSWNAVGSPLIYAYQGRYLLPVCVLLAATLIPKYRVLRARRIECVSIGIGVVGTLWYLAIAVATFY